MRIGPLERKDYDHWLQLWYESCEQKLAEDVTAETWHRLVHKNKSVYGLGVYNDQEILIGFLHYILHPTTGFLTYTCYMQDLYIHQDYRRMGLAKRLIWELQTVGKREKWNWIYWFAENDNIATQNLYKSLGIKMNFSLHMLQTQE